MKNLDTDFDLMKLLLISSHRLFSYNLNLTLVTTCKETLLLIKKTGIYGIRLMVIIFYHGNLW